MISSTTKIVALIGKPIQHSISPVMQNAAFNELELDYVYLSFEVTREKLREAIRGMKSLGIKGANVTIPHKSAVIKHLDELDKTAKRIGAVNTIKINGTKAKGYNTDGVGAVKALEEAVKNIKNKKILLLGAGGAARAIAFSLTEKSAKLKISNRTQSKSESLASEIGEKTGTQPIVITQKKEDMKTAIKESDILINSTSVGMHPHTDKTLVEAKLMHENLTVMDIVYNPLRTRLLEEAEKAGADTIDGLGMLVHQGAASFEIWTGRSAPIEIMRETAKKSLEEIK